MVSPVCVEKICFLRCCTDFCDIGWSGLGGFCYQFNGTKLAYSAANTMCRSSGGFLADIQSQEENEFVLKLITDVLNSIYIGYRDVVQEGSFVWDRTGAVGNYTNWNTGEPNNAGAEDCTVIRGVSLGNWNDVSCRREYPFLCKKGKWSDDILVCFLPRRKWKYEHARRSILRWHGIPLKIKVKVKVSYLTSVAKQAKTAFLHENASFSFSWAS